MEDRSEYFRNYRQAHKKEKNAYQKQWRKANPYSFKTANGSRSNTYIRENNLKTKYGLTSNDWIELFNKQNGKCKACGIHQTELGESLCVDHKHIPGFEQLSAAEKKRHVRGLLCKKCNTALGLVNDNPDTLQNLAEYLRRQ